MRKSNIVKPTGLKGNDKLNRMRELMGSAPINEDVKRSVVELTKEGPDGNIYAIVRENHEYYIKVSENKSNLVTEDFNYIGGLQNKKDKVYPSYAKAIKQLNLKFMSLNEAIGKSGQVNVFQDDNLITEHHGMNPNAKLSADKGVGDADEYVVNKKGAKLDYDAKEGTEDGEFGDNLADGKVDNDIEKVKLSENELAIDGMLSENDYEGQESACCGAAFKYGDICTACDEHSEPADEELTESKKKGYSIARALQEMDSVIDELSGEDEKIDAILESLGEGERAIMMEALKKKD
jgi:hypothetical protein